MATPIAAQPANRIIVIIGNDAIWTKHINVPANGIQGTRGTLNGRFIFGCVFRRNSIAQHTIAKANIVPTETISAKTLKGIKPASTPDTTPANTCAFLGTPIFDVLEKKDGNKWSRDIA